MTSRRLAVTALLFLSGGCALVYQTAWLREFRLIFGGSTAASGAVLAAFMGGLGIGNLLLICGHEPLPYDLALLKRRMAREPYRGAVSRGWEVEGLEGLLSRYVGGNELVDRVIAAGPPNRVNRDDRNRLEYGFARSLGAGSSFSMPKLRELAVEIGDHRPALALDDAAWEKVEANRMIAMATIGGVVPTPEGSSRRTREVAAILELYLQGQLPQSLATWREQARPPLSD